MKAEKFIEILGSDFYTGVPDSQLKALCDCLMNQYGIDPQHHIIAANEGNCVGLAAGYHLATHKVPVVYMQNSGEGNIINPVASLLHDQVYGIPVIFVVGWRGEPGVHDEPQHIYQGQVTVKLLEDMDISVFIVDAQTTEAELTQAMAQFRPLLDQGKDVAFVVKKGAITYDQPVAYHNANSLLREEIIRHIAAAAGTDPIVSTTGKASRELYEIRDANHQGHQYDFLTVGSMGHASSIALAIAIQKPGTKLWCVDGDGAALMHMGAMAVIGSVQPANLVHIIINNGAHETVGGMPTVAAHTDIISIAKACGYPCAMTASTMDELDKALQEARQANTLCLIEVKCAIGARADLGRPKTSAKENKRQFMEYLCHCD